MPGELGVDDQHRTRALPAAEPVERRFDAVERVDVGDHAAEVELARQRERREPRSSAAGSPEP